MLHYFPAPDATWLALAHADLALVVRAGDDAERLWTAVATGDLRVVLDALAANGLSSTPAFGLVELGADGVAHVMVRGGCLVSVATSDAASTEASGLGISTWSESFVNGAMAFTIVAEETAAVGFALPLVGGVVRSARLTSGVAAPVAPVVAAKPAPTVAPAPLIVPPPSLPSENTIVEPSGHASSGYSHLFEETIVRSVADAAVAPISEETELPEPEVVPPPAVPPLSGDHDGETVMSDKVSALLASRNRQSAQVASPPAGPSLYLQLPSGAREALTQPIVIGRSPSASKVSGANIPRLITIQGDEDISRNHVQFTLEGGTVVVTDLHSRNGTTIIAPGKPPQQLRQGEPTSILVGTVVDLGNGTSITVGQD